jgi:hypothetical protein
MNIIECFIIVNDISNRIFSTHIFLHNYFLCIFFKKKLYNFQKNVSRPPVPGIEPGVPSPESNALPPGTCNFDKIASFLLQYKV